MVGAGQLARMTQQAAIALGVELRVLAQSERDPAVLAGCPFVLGSPGEEAAVRALAEGADAVSFDHEQVPVELLRALQSQGLPLEPRPQAMLFAQDKHHQRRELAQLGLPVPPFALTRSRREVESFAAEHGWPLVAKAPRGGYDGRGVWLLEDPAQAAGVLESTDEGLLLEPHLRIELELAVLVARSRSGETASYAPVQTVQREAMAREILAPAQIDAGTAERARELALEIARAIDATGVVALELFLTPQGLVVNELALRPHNSAHHTIEGCLTSQFEQHLRAVLGWPLGSTAPTAPAVVTVNVVGGERGEDPRRNLARALEVRQAHVHLYEKAPRPGRKLGHVTVCAEELELARAAALEAVALLEGAGR